MMPTTSRRGAATNRCHLLSVIFPVTVVWTFAVAAAMPFASLSLAADNATGLVGRWDFDDGSGRDLSGHGHDAQVDEKQIYSLSENRACLRLLPDDEPMRIAASPDSPLAIARGTIALWLNLGRSDSVNVLQYDNDAVLFRTYRRYFQPRFRGEGKFKFTSGVIDADWPKYDMREWAFYPHTRAACGDHEWHHFAVAYDDQAKTIVGWRDGERIATVDLSSTEMQPLRRRGLEEIVTGKNVAGFIDDIRIYNRVLSDAEVRDLSTATRSVYAGRHDTIPTNRKMEVYEYREADRLLYRAWLQREPMSNQHDWDTLARIVAEGANSTIQTAAAELSAAAQSLLDIDTTVESELVSGEKVVLGTPETSEWIRKRTEQLGIDRIKHDGFIIQTVSEADGSTLVVAATEPAGVVFGTFHLIRYIQAGHRPSQLDVLENPQIPIRLVVHWSNFRGLPSDDWHGSRPGSNDNSSRYHSIFSWEDLRTGNTKLIRDWVRMMASAGWNAISPSEINWIRRNNFLEHLDEVEALADICRDYGIQIYWCPNYLLALDPSTAEQLYARVPDFGGYVLKLGSEKQNGDPRPQMVNRIADTLRPYGGHAVVRGFIYGNDRYGDQPYRNLIPYDVLAQHDGHYRDNVVIAPKGSPLDWDFSAPIPALDGVFQKTLSGSELVIDKKWPVSWVEKWKWWLEQDNYRKGAGSLNKFDVDCIMGVSMISPAPAWTTSPLNMVNYYGLGRLAWNSDLSVDEIYSEWILLTFGDDPAVVDAVKTILLLSDDVARKLYMYRGYRGVWIDKGNRSTMVQSKSTHTANSQGIGAANPTLVQRTLEQYASRLQERYADPVLGEEFLASFHFAEYDHRLSTGRTVIQDFYANLDEAVQLAEEMRELWKRLNGKVDQRRYGRTLSTLEKFVDTAMEEREECIEIFQAVSGRSAVEIRRELAAADLAAASLFNVQDYGAECDAAKNNAPAINAAIEACAAAGGGTVFVPTGIYGCGTIHLKSNVSLALDAGAVLKALADAMDPWEPNPHDQGLMDPAYYHWHASLICGEGLENIKIFGPGSLDGSALTRSSKVPAGTGDKAIALKRCHHVEILNLKIAEGGHYAILATGCADVRIDNVAIKTSRDGVNLSQCRNVVIANSQIDSVRYENGRPAGGDDAIKLGSDLSLGAVMPSENITVRNCFLASGCNALQFGTETVGAFRNIVFENIRIVVAGKAGIGITSNDGSVIENVRCQNISMEQTFLPIFVKLSDVARVPEGTFERGAIRNIVFENVTASDCFSTIRGAEMPSVIWGKPDCPIERITLKNVHFVVKGGHPAAEAVRSPPENDERFPQDVGRLPASAWYVRNARNVRVENCRFESEQSDGRPTLVADNVEELVLEATLLDAGVHSGSPVMLRNGSQVSIGDGAPKNITTSEPPTSTPVVEQSANTKLDAQQPREGAMTDRSGRELYVRAGSDSGIGDRKSPFGTITAALAVAQEGDSIHVAEGIYAESIVLRCNRIKLKGGYDAAFERGRDPIKYKTIIDGEARARPIRIDDEEAAVAKFRIDGFMIVRGLAGGSDSSDGKGGGILIADDSSGKIVRCTFKDNRANDDGGAIEYNGSGKLRIDRCHFYGNVSQDDGGAIRLQNSRSSTTISNCIFEKNIGLDKYVIQAKGDTRILNCTFVDNMSYDRGIIASRSKVETTGAKVTVANCVFANNRSLDNDPLIYADEDSAPIVTSHCLFFSNKATGGLGQSVEIGVSGHVEGDSLFLNAVQGDYRLREGSPAIDKGRTVDEDIKRDFAGEPRSQGTSVDIGAFESAPAPSE